MVSSIGVYTLNSVSAKRGEVHADLLIRHASGSLYQEARRRLTSAAPPQPLPRPTLFGDDPLPARQAGQRDRADKDVHYTPPWLARSLVQTALKWCVRPTGRALDILDPACGSGVFLIEAAREADRSRHDGVLLRGMDLSHEAGVMTDFCVGETRRDLQHLEVNHTVRRGVNSVREADWGSPDIVLMNPPFRAWAQLGHEQGAVKQALRGYMTGRPDLYMAFIAKAMLALKPGGVLASVVPSAFFTVKSAARLRQALTEGDYGVRFLGVFRGFETFDGATVEAACIVASKSPTAATTTTLIANKGNAEKAVRLLRAHAIDTSLPQGEGVEISESPVGM